MGGAYEVAELLRAISVETDRMGDAMAAAHGLHRTDLDALVHVMDAERAGEPLSPGQLARRLGLSAPATTALVDRLERSGHLRRRRHPEDRRRVVLEMQDKARDAGRAMFGPLGAGVRERFAALDPGGQEAVLAFLRDVRDLTAEARRRQVGG
ncbi:MarR family winged helix-turn-helix transcriptional regulator [Vallicoccus soli]|uniref:MarR family transcriptional regulator n=1 Tax=Vallicoccus soli TaxID=2339232 RepID=A0A3A3Z4B2_9ACTN|nr:MarR family transcriptional regulator [Vallicoccus soli]RJK95387.1 MarR family transcriptional regulator [Vallicoccus soli]